MAEKIFQKRKIDFDKALRRNRNKPPHSFTTTNGSITLSKNDVAFHEAHLRQLELLFPNDFRLPRCWLAYKVVNEDQSNLGAGVFSHDAADGRFASLLPDRSNTWPTNMQPRGWLQAPHKLHFCNENWLSGFFKSEKPRFLYSSLSNIKYNI